MDTYPPSFPRDDARVRAGRDRVRRARSADGPAGGTTPPCLLFTMLGLLAGLFVREIVHTAGGGAAAETLPSRAAPPPAPAGPADPVEVSVRAVLELPSPTPTEPPTPTIAPTVSDPPPPGPVTCGVSAQETGSVCRMPPPTPSPTPTLPTCWSAEAVAGRLCVLRPTAVAAPTNAPLSQPPA